MQNSIIDNKNTGLLGDKLKGSIKPNDRLAIISAYFTIYAFSHLKEQLKGVEEVRFLLCNNPNNGNFVHTDLLGDDEEKALRNRLDLRRISEECASWVKSKAKVRASSNHGTIGAKFIVVDGGSNLTVNTSFSDFTSSGLGYVPSSRVMLNQVSTDYEASQQMLRFFNQLWDNPVMVEDVKTEVLHQLERGFKDYSPSYLYFFTLYNIFKDYITELDEDKIIKTKTGFKDTEIWNKLYKFQKDGVVGAIDKIERYGGCIIADSVGLGKTFEALAIVKYYELRNDRVLVLCPKKLRENWTVYTLNDIRNSLVNDRFNYDVVNHTDLSRDKGLSGEINLETINWGNYDLVVIDESHNFRNNNPRRDVETRYTRLMKNIIQAGVRTKVLMLSATPVNNRMNDLKNQVAFITEGNDFAFTEYGISSIQEVMRRAQAQFNQWLKRDGTKKDVNTLLEMLDSRYFRLLDLVTIARSRKHIEKYYNIADIGKFPERLKPINIKADLDLSYQYPPLAHVNLEIRKLNLSAYSPLKYVRADKQEEYSAKYDMMLKTGSIFKQVDREESLLHLMRVNLLKRMESSINSFGITLQNLLSQIERFLDKIQNSSEYYDENLLIENIELDDPLLEDYLIGNKVKVLLQDMDLIRWKQDLLEDRDRLSNLLERTLQVDSPRDSKLQELKSLIGGKIANPINHSNKKIIIFTAFADTAAYLYHELAEWAKSSYGINSALVTGTGSNKTTVKGLRAELNDILISFSPISKEREKMGYGRAEDIDLLIATDCISEGQNLQDCDFLVNYDIHWNPVRIIQRFGRIDRLGSKNEAIQLVNFWPNMELDEYINLEARVSGRMVLLDISATGEENIIEPSAEMNDLDYRRKQLEQLQDSVIDLEDMQGGISITDLTFNDFKMDLMEFVKHDGGDVVRTPKGIHAVVQSNDAEIPKGVIFCVCKGNGANDREADYNLLAPYHLVYMGVNGEVLFSFTQGKHILDCYKKLCSGNTTVAADLVEAFKKETSNHRNMSAYTELLATATESILGKAKERGVSSIFSSGGTALLKGKVAQPTDFELVSYIVVC